jgi:ABC-type nitrate/sulfonate/bicarbonate transport system ATPase subunit
MVQSSQEVHTSSGPYHIDKGESMSVASNGESQQSDSVKLSIQNLSVNYPLDQGVLNVIQDLSLDIYDQEFISIVGVSGCGKSTLLNVIAGLLPFSSGKLLLDGKPIVAPGPDQRVDHYLERVALTNFQKSYPRELSGGMRKRVDVARAMAMEPEILLMDEPFGSLDVMTKERLQVDLLEIWTSARMTVVFITHDLEEAIYLSNRVAIMSSRPGRIRDLVEVPFEYPRPLDIKTESTFQDLRRRLAHELHRH